MIFIWPALLSAARINDVCGIFSTVLIRMARARKWNNIGYSKSHKYVRSYNGTDSEASVHKKRPYRAGGKNATAQKTLKELGSDC